MPSIRLILFLLLCTPFITQARAEDFGNLSANPFGLNSTDNPFGQGSVFAPNGVNNPFSPYGSPFSDQSATNFSASDAPKAEPSLFMAVRRENHAVASRDGCAESRMRDAYSLQYVERESDEPAPACPQAACGLSQPRLRDCSRSVHGQCGLDQQGNYRGKLGGNSYDPDSTSNQFGRYGSPFSPDSLNNPYGAGSPFRHDSPNNPYGQGWRIEGSR